MGMWGHSAGGWSAQHGPGARTTQLRRSTDGWDDDDLGKLYDNEVMRRLLPYLKPYKRQVVLAVCSMLVFAAAPAMQIYLIGLAIDDYIPQGDLSGLTIISLLLLALAGLSWAAAYIQQVSTAYMGHNILLTLRMQMFAHIEKLSLSFLDRNEVGRVMSRVQNDVTALQELLTTGLLTVLSDFVTLAFVIFFMLFLDVPLSLVTFMVVPVLVVVMAFWQSRARKAFVRVRQAIAVVNSNLQENVSGVRVIQSLSREEENSRRFANINRDNLSANVDAGRLTAAVMPAVELLVSVATALVVVFGGYQVLNSGLGVGVVIAFALYVQRFFDPIRDLVLQYTAIQRAMAGGQRIFEVLDTEPEIVDAEGAVTLADVRGEVEFDGVGFEYVDGVRVLDNIDLHVRPGESIAIVGPTGAGKSTLTSLVSRFYDATEGRVLIDGHDIKQIERSSLTRRLGIVLQDPFLFSGTVADNIRYGRLEATDEEVMEAAKTVGAHDFVRRLPGGYAATLHERGQNLSLGQRQLIAFARAVIAQPRILILDEATANVDTRTEVVIQRALKRLLKGRTSFVIAHRLSTIRGADRVVVLQDGRIAEVGTHAELLAHGGIYANLYRMTYEHAPSPNGDRAGGGRQAAAAPDAAAG